VFYLGDFDRQGHRSSNIPVIAETLGDDVVEAMWQRLALTGYREMDMGFWLQKAEAELGSPLGTHCRVER
jgi:hypothetical protein